MIKNGKNERNTNLNFKRKKEIQIYNKMGINKKKHRFSILLNMLKFILFFLFIFPSREALPINFQAGAFYGQRQVAEAEIKKVYGQGFIYFPYAAFIVRGFIIGAGYEGGYSRNGEIGLFKEKTNLRITGYEIFTGYEFKLKSLASYFKIGYGYYAYKQTIESQYLSGFKVNEKKGAPAAALGLKIYPLKNIFLATEIKYVPLKVKPHDRQVDLSGFRYLAGIGFSF